MASFGRKPNLMEFHGWITMFDEAGKINPEEKHLPINTRTKIEEKRITESLSDRRIAASRVARLMAERIYVEANRPYYNIHPKIFPKLAKTNLDQIPCEFIEIPKSHKDSNVDVICLRFCEDIPIQFKPAGTKRVPAFDYDPENQAGVRSVLLSRTSNPDNSFFNFTLFLDEGFRQHTPWGIDCLLCNTFNLHAPKGITIPKVLQNTIDNEKEPLYQEALITYQHKIENIFRVAVTVGFLANANDELLVPDVLSKDRQKYQEAIDKGLTEAAETILARSRRRGKNGWNVGTNEMFVGEDDYSHSSSEGGGKELKYSHFRTGHPHAVRYGKGKSQVKIKWFRTTRVRPDLPFKE
jgi:hypothetical protein